MKKTKKSILIMIISLAVSIVFLTGCNNSESTAIAENYTKDNPLVIKFSHVAAEQSPKGEAALKFKEVLEQKADGRIEVQVFPSSQLYGDKDEMEALQGGNVHVIAPSTAKMVGFNPSFQVNDLPFLFKDSEAVHKFWDGDIGQKLLNSLEDANIKGLATWDLGFKIFTSSKPIENLDDFKGQKFRTQAGKVLESQFNALDAAGTAIPFSETYTALQQGTVDGLENTWSSIDEQKFQEVQNYALVTNHGRIDYVLLTNKEWYEQLPDDLRKVFDESVKEATEFERAIVGELNKKAEENVRKSDMEITKISEKELENFKKAMETVYEEFEDTIGKEYIDAARES